MLPTTRKYDYYLVAAGMHIYSHIFLGLLIIGLLLNFSPTNVIFLPNSVKIIVCFINDVVSIVHIFKGFSS